MTREEALHILRYKVENDNPMQWHDALEMAIKALEQEPILDKIRAEIETMPYAIISLRYVNKDKVINILDKYKAESEE